MTAEEMEARTEKIPTKESILEIMSRLAPEHTLVQERHDEQGLYLLDVSTAGEKPGQTVQYEYLRKGRFPKNETAETVIQAVYYEDGIPYDGYPVAYYDHDSGEWKMVE